MNNEIILLPSENENPTSISEASEMFIPSLIAILLISLILSLVIKLIEYYLPVKTTTFVSVFLLLTANLMIASIFYLTLAN